MYTLHREVRPGEARMSGLRNTPLRATAIGRLITGKLSRLDPSDVTVAVMFFSLFSIVWQCSGNLRLIIKVQLKL